ncbi:MAG: type II secretion system protein [Tepidisphaeraceae bacterium]
MKRSRLSAFTLVELLVVIGIIALLLAILLPSLTKARQSANAVKCMSNLRQINIYLNIYANENGGWCLPANNLQNNWESGDWSGILARSYFKAKMTDANGNWLKGSAGVAAIGSSGLGPFLKCPSTERPPYNPNTGINSTGMSDTPFKWTYTYNRGFGDIDKLQGMIGDGSYDPITTPVQYGMKKRTQIPRGVLVMADMASWLPNNRGANNFRFFTFSREINPLDGSWATSGGYLGMPHGTQKVPLSNVLLFSGEVLTVNPKKFNDLPNKYFIDAREWAANSRTRRVTSQDQHRLN